MAVKKHHNHTESEIVDMKRSERYVQNWNYFRFVVAILKDWLAVDSNSTCLASMSSISPKTYAYSLTSAGCEHTCQTETASTFLAAIFISGVTVTSGDVNIIAIEKVYPENIGIAVGIFFLCALETK